MSILRKSRILCVALVILLVAVIMVFVGSFTASADVYVEGDYEYTISNGEVTITKYIGAGGDVTVPSTLGGYPVTTIGVYIEDDMCLHIGAFGNCDTLTSITMPSVTKIGDYCGAFCFGAFENCVALTSVTMPNVTIISERSFWGCDALVSINIPKNVENIRENPFELCDNLTNITVDDDNKYYSAQDGILFNKDKTELVCYPGGKREESYTVLDSVTTIGDYAFASCEFLTSVDMMNVTTIDEYAFYYSSLENVSMLNVVMIYDDAFANCDSLVNVNIPKVTEIGSGAFANCDALTAIHMPSVVTICSSAFSSCKALKSVSMPNAISIDGAFGYCSSLVSVSMPSVIELKSATFYACESLKSVSMPSLMAAESNTFLYCNSELTIYGYLNSYAQQYAIDNNINFDELYEYTILNDEVVITGCNTGGDIIIPSTIDGYPVTTIADSAFSYCRTLTTIDMPSVTTIGNQAFRGCSSLTSVDISNVVAICDWAFYGCSSLIDVYIPDTVVKIGLYVFADCNNLTTITVDSKNEYYSSQDGVLFNKNKTELISYPGGKSGEYTIPESVTSISGAFYLCRRLTSINTSNVTSVSGMEFQNCTSLVSAYMPNVVVIENAYAGAGGGHSCTGAFSDCVSLTTVYMPNIYIVGSGAFYGCRSLVTVSMPNVSSIGYCAFSYCDSLDSFSVDASNEFFSVQDGILFNKDKTELVIYPANKSLSTYTVPDSVKTIGAGAFDYCYNLVTVKLPNVTTIKRGGFFYCKSLEVIDAPNVNTIDSWAFEGCDSLTNISLPSVSIICWEAFVSCDSLTSVTIPNVTVIDMYAFSGCSSDLTIQGYLNSYAHQYACENNINFAELVIEKVKSVSYEVKSGKIIFTVVTGAGDYDRIKVMDSDNLKSYIAYTKSYIVNSDGDYVWTIKADAPTETEEYVFDIRSTETGKYMKEYFNYEVEIISIFKSATYEIVDGKMVFTVVTAAGDFNRVKLSFADDLKNYIAYTNSYTINSDGDYVWTIKADAPTETEEYVFDIRSTETGKYLKQYYYYEVEAATPTILSASHTISDGKIIFTVVTKPGDFNRIKVTTADNLGGSLGVANTYTVNADGNYVWTVKATEPSENTTYAFDLRNATTGKYLKEYFYYEVEAATPTIISASHTISDGKIIFIVVTKPGDFNRIKVTTADNLGGSLGVANTYTVNAEGNYVWTIKVTEPSETTNYAFDIRNATTSKYLKEYFCYEVDASTPKIISVSHEISADKIFFTVVTTAGDYNRVKVAFADDAKGYIAYTNTYEVNSDGNYVWTIKTTAPTATTSYAFDLRASDMNYLKDYYYYETSIADNTYVYSISNGEVTIVKYNGNGGDVVIPKTIEGYPVTKIGYRAFFNCASLTSIDTANVKRIDWYAFDSCKSLVSVNMPSVTFIDWYAFSSCIALESVTMSNVEEIYSGAFNGCNNLTIYATLNSYANEYANENNIKFVATDEQKIKSVTHRIDDGRIIFTVVTKPGDFERIKVTAADNLGGSLGVGKTYTVDSDGNYVWTIKITAPTETKNYAFDLRSVTTGKYIKEYGYYTV